ncbi:MAG: PD-(D/E)XK nuclease family protein [Acinetobacter sp.]
MGCEMEKNIDLEQFSQNLKALQRISHDVKNSMFERLDVSRYENVSSKMLEFLLDSTEDHGIGNLAIISLLEEAKIKFVNEPVTKELLSEVYSVSNKLEKSGRIDLVVHLENHTLVIENKISHILNNPFSVYVDYVEKEYKESKGYSGNNYFIVMGIKAPRAFPEKFIFVSHDKFCQNLKVKLSSIFKDREKAKSYYFIQDYIEAISNMSNTKLNEDKENFFKFIANNYQKLDQIKEQQKYIFDIANEYLKEILGYAQCKEKYFLESKIEKNNEKDWGYKGCYIYSSAIKKILNGSEVYIVINVLAQGIFLAISMHDNRRKQYYAQDDIVKYLKGSRLIPSLDKMEQLFSFEAVVAKWNYTEFDPKLIAKTLDKYVEKIEALSMN